MSTAYERYQEAEARYLAARKGFRLPSADEWFELLEELATSADAAIAELRLMHTNTQTQCKRIEKRKREAKRTIKKLRQR